MTLIALYLVNKNTLKLWLSVRYGFARNPSKVSPEIYSEGVNRRLYNRNIILFMFYAQNSMSAISAVLYFEMKTHKLTFLLKKFNYKK